MMPLQADSIYLDEQTILTQVLAAWAARLPGVGNQVSSVVYIWTQVFANVGSGFTLGLQLLHDDMFVQTMSVLALQREGEEIGRPQKGGVLATGEVTLSGAGGTFIAAGSQVGASQPVVGPTLVFETTTDVTIPNPGTPTAPVAADDGTSGNPTGTLEYAITFVTAGGETALGAQSNALAVVTHKVDLTSIPLGGAGTTARKVYRSKNGGAFQFVATIDDNSTTTYTDNIADGALGGNPPSVSTAESITVEAQATETGVAYDVGVGAISVLVNVDGDVTDVTNEEAFIGGEDSEAIEAFRAALLAWKQNPQSGSPNDLVAWATSIDGVDSAAVFKNVNLAGDDELGSVVVRIAGVGGSFPSDDLIDETLAYVESKDLANITIYVGDFDELDVNVTVHAAPAEGYTIDDIEDSVSAAITAYIQSVPVGGVVYVAGISSAVFGLPGVRTLIVNTPSDDVEATDVQKPMPGTIVVDEEPWS